jgi:hypothetical protein
LVDDAVVKLEDRIVAMESLPLQGQLLLLRLCWVPVLMLLIRTIHPDIIRKGVERFDDVIWECVQKFANDRTLPKFARVFVGLPARLGGMGILRQANLMEIAYGSSLALSHAFLRNQGYMPCEEAVEENKKYVVLCANNLNWPVNELLVSPKGLTPQLQRRASELLHEKRWKTMFWLTKGDEVARMRLLENGGTLAKAWMRVFPVSHTTRLSDKEVRYGLRKVLGSPFLDVTGSSPICFRGSCQQREHATHHLLCKANHRSRTMRHTLVNERMQAAVREVCGSVQSEVAWGNGLQADFVATFPDSQGVAEAVDISVVTVESKHNVERNIIWPTKAAVNLEIAEEKKRGAKNPNTPFSWEDKTNEQTHPQVVHIRMLRKMAFEQGVMRAIRFRENEKIRKYGNHDCLVRPFVLSAGGGMGTVALDLVRVLTENLKGSDGSCGSICVEADIREKFLFRARMYGNLSVVLLQFASRMSYFSTHTALGHLTSLNALSV